MWLQLSHCFIVDFFEKLLNLWASNLHVADLCVSLQMTQVAH